MNLLLPLGLIGLIGIPVILLIHIIKPKYHERTISSTYIWHLAKKYRKRKIPFEKLTQFFLIALQFLIVGAISFLLAKPLISSPEKIVNDQIIMVDCSASMNTINDGKTRYNIAVDQIVKSFDKYSEENKFTIIFVDENPNDGNIIRSTNRAEIEHALREDGRCTYAEITNAEYQLAIKQVELALQQNKNADVSIYTDHQMKVTGDIEVINVAKSEWNVALLDSVIELNEDSGYFDFKTTLCSYNKDADVVLELVVKNAYNNAGLVTDGDKYIQNVTRSLKKNTKVEVSFEGLNIYRFTEASFIIKEREFAPDMFKKDAFIEDNSFYAFNGNDEKFRVQLISESRTFVSAAINILGTCDEIVVSKNLSMAQPNGFDLYIYDTIGPDTLPNDGTVWIINPLQGQTYAGGALETGSQVSIDFGGLPVSQLKNNLATALQYGGNVVNTNVTKPHVQEVIKNIKTDSFYVTKYTQLTNYDSNVFDVCLSTKDGQPLVLAGKQGLTNLCVMSFDLHCSNLPVTFYMPLLVSNMMDFSVKRIVTEHFYNVGETIELNVNSSVKKVNLLHNGETIVYEEGALKNGVSFRLKTSGVYTVIMNPDESSKSTYSFFAGIASSESNFAISHSLSLSEVAGEEEESKKVKSDDKDISMYFAIALLVLLIIEWGVQYREQY